MAGIDWYARRHELRSDMVFKTLDGSVIKLDRMVPGDGTKWFVIDWYETGWAHYDSTLEPGDLAERLQEWEGTPHGRPKVY